MKYSIQAIHFLESVEEEQAVFENLSDAFEGSKYFLKPLSAQNTRRNFNNFIPLCQYAGQIWSLCQIHLNISLLVHKD